MVILFLLTTVVVCAVNGLIHLLLHLEWRRRPRDVYEGRPEAFPEGFYQEPLRPANRLFTGVVFLSVAALALFGLLARLLDVW